MNHLLIGLISFVAIFCGALIGFFVARRLPGEHLDNRTQSAVTVSVAVVGTLSALVLGLMISAANNSFSKRSDGIRELSLQVIRIERNLRRYGPEADGARAKLKEWATVKNQQLFPENGQRPPPPEVGIQLLESVQDALLALTPTNDRQKYLQTLCETLSSNVIQARWALEQRQGNSIPGPFLVLLIFWLTIVFASFGLFSPANSTAMTTLFLCATAVAGGIVVIEELDNPMSGLIRIPNEPMRKALIEITH